MSQKKKGPPDIPDRGERCRLRGNHSATGTLVKFDPESDWATVAWDDGVTAPQMCHRFELARISTP